MPQFCLTWKLTQSLKWWAPTCGDPDVMCRVIGMITRKDIAKAHKELEVETGTPKDTEYENGQSFGFRSFSRRSSTRERSPRDVLFSLPWFGACIHMYCAHKSPVNAARLHPPRNSGMLVVIEYMKWVPYTVGSCCNSRSQTDDGDKCNFSWRYVFQLVPLLYPGTMICATGNSDRGKTSFHFKILFW